MVMDRVEAGGVRRMCWASDQAIGFEQVEEGWQVRAWEDAALDLHYVELVQPYRGPVEILFPEWPKARRMLAWAIGADRVSVCMREGAHEFARLTGRWPGVAYIHKLPQGIAPLPALDEVTEVEGVMLCECEWAVPGFVLLGG